MSVLVVIPIAIIIFVTWNGVQRNISFKYIQKLFTQERPDEILSYLKKPNVRFSLPSYNLNLMKFNANLMKEDYSTARHILDDLSAVKLSRSQQLDLLIRSFDFYIAQGLYEQAATVLTKIRLASKDSKLIKDCEQAYDIAANNSYAYIHEMKAELSNATATEKLRLLSLLVAQYINAGDKKKAKEYKYLLDHFH